MLVDTGYTKSMFVCELHYKYQCSLQKGARRNLNTVAVKLKNSEVRVGPRTV